MTYPEEPRNVEEQIAQNADTGDYICFECGDTYDLRHGADDGGLCDPCAQDTAARLRAQVKALERRLSLLGPVLNDIDDYLQDREDVRDGSYGEQAPNREMVLLQALRQARGQ